MQRDLQSAQASASPTTPPPTIATSAREAGWGWGCEGEADAAMAELAMLRRSARAPLLEMERRARAMFCSMASVILRATMDLKRVMVERKEE